MATLRLVLGSVVLLCATTVAAQEPPMPQPALRLDPELIAELQAKAVPAWEAIEQTFASVSVALVHTCKESLGGQLVAPEFRRKYRLAWDRNRGVARSRAETGPPGEFYDSVANSRYSFEVWKQGEQARGELRSARLFKSAVNEALSGSDQPKGFRENWENACEANRFGPIALRLLLGSAEFTPIEAVEEQAETGRQIRVSAQYVGETKPDFRRKGGIYTVVLEPVHQYRLLRGKITFADRDDSISTTLIYHDVPHVFVPKLNHCIQRLDQGNAVTEWHYEFELPGQCDVPDAEFMLPFYGFDESVLLPLSPNRSWRWWLMGLGAAVLLVGVWLLARRRAQA
jgi:hypothetical protein